MTHFCPLVPPISRAVAPPPAIVIQLVIRVISLHSDLTWVSSPSAGSGPWAPPSPWSGPSLPPPPCLSSSPPWAGPCSQRRCTSASPAPGASPSHCQLQHTIRGQQVLTSLTSASTHPSLEAAEAPRVPRTWFFWPGPVSASPLCGSCPFSQETLCPASGLLGTQETLSYLLLDSQGPGLGAEDVHCPLPVSFCSPALQLFTFIWNEKSHEVQWSRSICPLLFIIFPVLFNIG